MRHSTLFAAISTFSLLAVGSAQAATPIVTCGTTITKSGPYVVTKNLAVKSGSKGPCIAVNSDYVAIDLDGFVIDCEGQPVAGIGSPAASNGIIVRGGSISRCAHGVGLSADTAVLVEDIQAAASVLSTSGVAVGAGSMVLESVTNDNSDNGVLLSECPANALDNTAVGNANHDILHPINSAECNVFNNLAPR